MADKLTAHLSIKTDVSLWSCTDLDDKDVPVESFVLDSDNDVLIQIDGFVIDTAEKELLEKAQELTSEDWDLIATSQLIEQ